MAHTQNSDNLLRLYNLQKNMNYCPVIYTYKYTHIYYKRFLFPACGVSKMLDEKMHLFSCMFAFFFNGTINPGNSFLDH